MNIYETLREITEAFGQNVEGLSEIVRFSDQEKKVLAGMGYTMIIRVDKRTLKDLGIEPVESSHYGKKAREAAAQPAIGAEVAVNPDRIIPKNTFYKDFNSQVKLEEEANSPKIPGVVFTHPQTPADAVIIAQEIQRQGYPILDPRISRYNETRVGDGSITVSKLDLGYMTVRISDFYYCSAINDVGLVRIAVPKIALQR